MKSYTYNGMNAQEIANKIISNEEEYLKIDFDVLCFEDKCDYVAHYNAFYHPLRCHVKNFNEIKNEFIPELCKRAEDEDPDSIYYLAVLHPEIAHCSNEQRAMIEHAMEAGSLEAHIYFASWFCRKDALKAYTIIKGVLKKCSGEGVSDKTDKLLYHCYSILMDVGQTMEERLYYKKLLDDLALKLVLRGEYAMLTHLCVKNKTSKDYLSKKHAFDEETLFWKTVSFLVEFYFYEKWGIYSSDELGICMIRGIGCDPDFKRAKSFYLDVYFRRSFDRAKMLEVLGMNKNISLKEAEQSFRRSIENGDVEGYWKLILLGIMQSDISFVDQICNEAIINNPKRLMEIMPKAYTKLLLSK